MKIHQFQYYLQKDVSNNTEDNRLRNSIESFKNILLEVNNKGGLYILNPLLKDSEIIAFAFYKEEKVYVFWDTLEFYKQNNLI